jgi:hypothetical protein
MRAAIAVVAAAAIVPAAAQAHHQPGHTGGGGGGGGGNLTLAATPNPVVAGRTLTLSGKLTGSNNSGQVVNIFADPFPFADSGFTPAGGPTTNATGDYQLTLKPTINTRYQARRGSELSPIVSVLVRPAVSLRLSDYTPKRAQVVRFYGRVCPQHDGAVVAIQRRYSTGYRTVRRATLKDIAGSTCSSYSRRFRVFRDGRYRTVISGHSDHARGTSRSRVANAHN